MRCVKQTWIRSHIFSPIRNVFETTERRKSKNEILILRSRQTTRLLSEVFLRARKVTTWKSNNSERPVFRMIHFFLYVCVCVFAGGFTRFLLTRLRHCPHVNDEIFFRRSSFFHRHLHMTQRRFIFSYFFYSCCAFIVSNTRLQISCAASSLVFSILFERPFRLARDWLNLDCEYSQIFFL